MVLMTMIARVVDGLPLAATMQEDEQVTMNNILNINCTTCCTSLQFLNVPFNSKYMKKFNLYLGWILRIFTYDFRHFNVNFLLFYS